MISNNSKYEPWIKNSNKSYDWFSTDSKTLFEHNLSHRYNLLKANDWINTTFTYDFNKYGFRSKEFTDKDSIMFLGCSITQGIGLPDQFTFPEIVCRQLDLQSCNLGMHGTSADTAFRLATKYLKMIMPKVVVCHLVFPERLEILTLDGADFLLPSFDRLVPKFDDSNISFENFTKASEESLNAYKNWISVPENSMYNHMKNLLAIEKLCNDLDIKFVSISDRSEYIGYEKNFARDLIHPGKGLHNMLANLALEKINK